MDDPNDQVFLNPSKDALQFRKEGIQEPEKYLHQIGWRPQVSRLQRREMGNVRGYLLLSPELNRLVQHNKDRAEVRVWVEDPHTLPALERLNLSRA